MKQIIQVTLTVIFATITIKVQAENQARCDRDCASSKIMISQIFNETQINELLKEAAPGYKSVIVDECVESCTIAPRDKSQPWIKLL